MAKSFPKSNFIGIDFTQVAIDKANDQAKKLGLQNLNFLVGNLDDLTPEKYGKFDLITSFDVIHDLKNPQLVLNNISNCLLPKGCHGN